jgi:hypothetical protein
MGNKPVKHLKPMQRKALQVSPVPKIDIVMKTAELGTGRYVSAAELSRLKSRALLIAAGQTLADTWVPPADLNSPLWSLVSTGKACLLANPWQAPEKGEHITKPRCISGGHLKDTGCGCYKEMRIGELEKDPHGYPRSILEGAWALPMHVKVPFIEKAPYLPTKRAGRVYSGNNTVLLSRKWRQRTGPVEYVPSPQLREKAVLKNKTWDFKHALSKGYDLQNPFATVLEWKSELKWKEYQRDDGTAVIFHPDKRFKVPKEKPLPRVFAYSVITREGLEPVYKDPDPQRNVEPVQRASAIWTNEEMEQAKITVRKDLSRFLQRFDSFDADLFGDEKGIIFNTGEPKYPSAAWFSIRSHDDDVKGVEARAQRTRESLRKNPPVAFSSQQNLERYQTARTQHIAEVIEGNHSRYLATLEKARRTHTVVMPEQAFLRLLVHLCMLKQRWGEKGQGRSNPVPVRYKRFNFRKTFQKEFAVYVGYSLRTCQDQTTFVPLEQVWKHAPWLDVSRPPRVLAEAPQEREPYRQREDGFGKKFFEMPAATKYFLPDSKNGRTFGYAAVSLVRNRVTKHWSLRRSYSFDGEAKKIELAIGVLWRKAEKGTLYVGRRREPMDRSVMSLSKQQAFDFCQRQARSGAEWLKWRSLAYALLQSGLSGKLEEGGFHKDDIYAHGTRVREDVLDWNLKKSKKRPTPTAESNPDDTEAVEVQKSQWEDAVLPDELETDEEREDGLKKEQKDRLNLLDKGDIEWTEV